MKSIFTSIAILTITACAATPEQVAEQRTKNLEERQEAVAKQTAKKMAEIDAALAASRKTITEKDLNTDAFVLTALNLLGVSESTCDATAISDQTTDWTCAPYSYGHTDFISNWERVASSDEMSSLATLTPTSNWMFFNEGSTVDFYGKTYTIGTDQALIAYDPSEVGREIFIGIGSNMAAIAQVSAGIADTSFLPKSVAQLPVATHTKQARRVEGEYNCSDFSNQQDAIAFFKSNGFSSVNDPYGLDADGNGIPCEIFKRTTTKTPSSTNAKCPAGKSWVSSYTRSNGTKVRGHCRKRR